MVSFEYIKLYIRQSEDRPGFEIIADWRRQYFSFLLFAKQKVSANDWLLQQQQNRIESVVRGINEVEYHVRRANDIFMAIACGKQTEHTSTFQHSCHGTIAIVDRTRILSPVYLLFHLNVVIVSWMLLYIYEY